MFLTKIPKTQTIRTQTTRTQNRLSRSCTSAGLCPRILQSIIMLRMRRTKLRMRRTKLGIGRTCFLRRMCFLIIRFLFWSALSSGWTSSSWTSNQAFQEEAVASYVPSFIPGYMEEGQFVDHLSC